MHLCKSYQNSVVMIKKNRVKKKKKKRNKPTQTYYLKSGRPCVNKNENNVYMILYQKIPFTEFII